ncbi:MAG: phosphatase PAP2 family protein [Actinobacteria bacterium]|nr:phosphatase PAP2 family protein [Actinomycetota bacterium]
MSLTSRVSAFDDRADRALEPWRARRGIDRMFHLASEYGDFSLIWQVIGAAYGLGIRRDWREWLLFTALLGLESLVVNQGIKRLFRRTRPTETGDPRFQVRRPSTSSFPSGHASSAFFAATLLTVWSGWPWAPLWFAIATVVGLSRAIVRIHHPSDVVGGMVTGLLLAQVALLSGAADLLRH